MITEFWLKYRTSLIAVVYYSMTITDTNRPSIISYGHWLFGRKWLRKEKEVLTKNTTDSMKNTDIKKNKGVLKSHTGHETCTLQYMLKDIDTTEAYTVQ